MSSSAVRKRFPSALLVLLLSCSRPPETATVHDDLGRAVALPTPIRRVVTLAPNLTEMVYAVGSGALLAGTDDFSDFPDAAAKLPKVGGMQPNIEKIVALRPDVVLASTSGNHPQLAPALEGAKIPLYVVRTERLAQIPAAMERIGAMLDAPDRGRVVAALQQAIARQRSVRSVRPRILFAVWTAPIYVAGRETFTDDLIALTGGVNVVEAGGWPQYSLEALVAHPPDLILYPDKSVTALQAAELKRSIGGKALAVAVNENRFTRPGPRVAEAAGELNRIIDQWEKQQSTSKLTAPPGEDAPRRSSSSF